MRRVVALAGILWACGCSGGGGSTSSSGSTGSACPDRGACGSGSTSGSTGTTSGSTGTSGGSSGSSTGSSGTGSTFSVSGTPWVVEEHRLPGEASGAIGTIEVFRDGNGVTGATVLVNNTPIPADSLIPGFYDLAKAAAIPNLGPGQTLTVSVTAGADSLTASVTCPTQVNVTAPSEGASLQANTSLSITWDQPTLAGTSAVAGFWHWAAAGNTSGPFYAEPEVQTLHGAGNASASVNVPGDGTMILLVFPGPSEVADHGGGRTSVLSCALARRVGVSVTP